MRNTLLLFTALSFLLALSNPAAAQKPKNDGFYRRDGQMHVLRNGQLRPMTRDARLPTGLLVTKDGFVVDTKGQRTELREGQGCDLKGNVATVTTAQNGSLALATRPVRGAQRPPAASPARSILDELLGVGVPDQDENEEGEKDDDKYEEKARENRQKQEEKQREYQQKRQEQLRKWVEKHGRGKGRGKGKNKHWDD